MEPRRRWPLAGPNFKLSHYHAVRYLEDGGKLRDLQKILGHGSIAVTERYLAHLTPEEQVRT